MKNANGTTTKNGKVTKIEDPFGLLTEAQVGWVREAAHTAALAAPANVGGICVQVVRDCDDPDSGLCNVVVEHGAGRISAPVHCMGPWSAAQALRILAAGWELV